MLSDIAHIERSLSNLKCRSHNIEDVGDAAVKVGTFNDNSFID